MLLYEQIHRIMQKRDTVQPLCGRLNISQADFVVPLRCFTQPLRIAKQFSSWYYDFVD
jgi:hypothetical protein